MCLESRSAALLVALCSIVTSGGARTPPAGGSPAATRNLLPTTPQIADDARSGDRPPMRNGAQIRGRLVTTDHQPLASGTLVMTPEDSDGSASSINGAMMPDGSFVFSNVPPGSYLIRALAQVKDSDASLFALFRVTVRDRDVDGVEMLLRPGATISGRIIFDPGSVVRDLAGVRVRAPFNDGGSFGDAQTGAPRRDGTFTVQGVMAGAHLLVVEGLPAPWSVKNVMYRGQDITDTGLEADSGQRLAGIGITLTNRATEVSGTVRDGDGRVAPEARVLFVPVPAGLWPLASRRYARATTDTGGHYSVRGLPPGAYKVMAALELGDRDVYRRDILRAVRDQGVAITLETEHARVVDLSVTQLTLQHRAATR